MIIFLTKFNNCNNFSLLVNYEYNNFNNIFIERLPFDEIYTWIIVVETGRTWIVIKN